LLRGAAALVFALALFSPTVAAADPLDVVGFADPGTAGLNATVVGLDGFAYLGSWGGPSQCPSPGARVFDVREPSQPAQVGAAAAYQGTTAEHLAVAHYATQTFVGTVLFVGIQRCVADSGAAAGLAMWDVSNPYSPVELGFVPTGRGSRGVHEFTVRQQGDRWIAYLAVPNSRLAAMGWVTCGLST